MNIEITKESVGNVLLFQILGMVLSNTVWNKIVKSYSFKGIFYFLIAIEIITSIFALIAAHLENIFLLYGIFFIVGFGLSAFKIANEGMFLEITDETNRSSTKE